MQIIFCTLENNQKTLEKKVPACTDYLTQKRTDSLSAFPCTSITKAYTSVMAEWKTGMIGVMII